MKSSRLPHFERKYLAYLLIIPTMAVIGFVNFYPIAYSFYISLFKWELTQPWDERVFVSLENYVKGLRDPLTWVALENTFIFTIGAVGLEFALGLGIALLLSEETRGRGILESVIILPLMIAPVVVGLMWKYIYDPEWGIAGYFFRTFFGISGIGFLNDPSIALLCIIIVDVWYVTPFVVLVLVAGLSALPVEPFEAARVDGASWWQRVRYIALPMLKPLVLLVILARSMDAFRVFDIIYVLTRGGPGMATESISLYAYRYGFMFFRTGFAMSISYIILIIILITSILYVKVIGKQLGG